MQIGKLVSEQPRGKRDMETKSSLAGSQAAREDRAFGPPRQGALISFGVGAPAFRFPVAHFTSSPTKWDKKNGKERRSSQRALSVLACLLCAMSTMQWIQPIVI